MKIDVNSMINYLEAHLKDMLNELERFGSEDRIVKKKVDAVIANKDMIEALIGMPVNLKMNGEVSIGF